MLRTITPPASDPVTVAEAKVLLGASVDDDLVAAYISAATRKSEAMTQRRFITQTLELVLQDWGCGRVRLPVAPIAASDGIVSVKYIDWPSQTQLTLDPSAYVVKTDGATVSLVPAYGTIWPIVFPFSSEPIVIRFTAGEAAASENVKTAIKLMVRQLHAMGERSLYQSLEKIDGVIEQRWVVSDAADQVIDRAARSLLISEAWN